MDASGVVLERLELDRLDELIDVQNEIFTDYIIPLRSTREFFIDFQKSVGGRLSDVLVAIHKGNIVGYANTVIDGAEAWIGGVGVVPAMRGKGIGTRLMMASEDVCRRRDVSEIILEVIEGNSKAQQLYERLGYRFARKYLSAEGKPIKFEGFGEHPEIATLKEVLELHQRSYGDTCWQRRKQDALIQSAKDGERYKVRGGFVVVRSVDTTGFVPFLGVVPEKRRAGIGTALARFALNRLWEQGAFKVGLYNVNEDEQTLRMLNKFDFKVTLKQIEMRKSL
ncbi:MAG TPA: GNAT family N-acetyltransferase [Thermoplasmata archaeon]